MTRLVFCATLLLAALAAVQADIYEEAGYNLQVRKRLGHLNDAPFTDLYKYYAESLLKEEHKDLPTDDYRRFLPAGDECVIFLKDFQSHQYKLNSLYEFIVLDACLGYVFDSKYQEVDSQEMDLVREHLDNLKKDSELGKLWNDTNIENINQDTKSCFADLLMNDVLATKDYPDVVCNTYFIQIYLQFAECQKGRINEEERKKDSYLKFVYDLLKKRSQVCVEYEYQHIEAAVREAYAKAKTDRVALSFTQYWSEQARQQRQNMWPWQVIRLFAALQNTEKQVTQRQVLLLLRGVSVGDQRVVDKLLENIAGYATKALKPKRVGHGLRKPKKSSSRGSDPTGEKSYTKLIDKLCSFFRTSDSVYQYDYATPIVRLVQMLKYPDLFEMSESKFTDKIVANATESAPIYIGTWACNILTFTQGRIETPSANTKQHYKVEFKPDTTGMVIWPVLPYY